MKTNIITINGVYAAHIGYAEFCAGITEEDEYVELCDVYKDIDGNMFGYDPIEKQIVKDHGRIYPLSAIGPSKRGRHSKSNNKTNYQRALGEKILYEALNNLPF